MRGNVRFRVRTVLADLFAVRTLPKLVLPPPDSCEIGKSVGRASMTKCCNSSDRRTCCGARPVTTTCPTARSPADRAASERHRERTGSRRTLSTRSSRATRGRPVASNMARATLRPVQQTSRLVMLVTVLREIQHTVSWSPTRTSYPIGGCDGRPAWLRCLAEYKKRLEL